MSNENKVAERVRSYREQQKLSVEDLAAKSGVDVGVVQAIEAGEVIPALGMLTKIASSLGQRLGTFMDDQYKPDPIITRAADASTDAVVRSCVSGLGYTARSLAPGKPDRQMDPYHVELTADCRCFEYSNEGEEFIICEKGQVELTYGGEKIVLGPGDTAYYNSVVKHSIRVVGGQTASVYGIVFMPM